MGEKFDLVIIGAGPGGYAAALRARQLGLSVALVEKEKIGGVCLNWGCIPTKALLSDVEGIRWARRLAAAGILLQEPRVSFTGLMGRKSQVVEGLVATLQELLASSGVTIHHGKAKIQEPGSVAVENAGIIDAKNIVIATGSRSWVPPIEGVNQQGVVGVRQILALEEIPDSLLIIGGGIIGQEFAGIFSALGTQVTILEALDRILLEVDGEMARKFSTLCRANRIATEVGVKVHRIVRAGNLLRTVYEKKSREKSVETNLILMATGRRPYFEDVGIEELGMGVETGAIQVDRHLGTTVEGIYAIGDVTGKAMLAHVASHHGEIVAETVAGRDRSLHDEAVPSCVFTVPQIAWVGLTEEQAKSSGLSFRTSTFSLTASGKAQALGESRGWVKLIEESTTNRLIGAHLIGPHVSELLGELTLAIDKRMTPSDLAHTIHPHPTISEAVKEAAMGFLGGPMHSAPRVKSFTAGS